MAKQDFYLNRLLRDPERFADFFNALLFKGLQILHATDLEKMESRSGVPFWDSDNGRQLVQRQRDLMMKAGFGICFAVLGTENQNAIHYAMPVRNMLYDSLEYTRQVQELEKAHKAAGDHLKGDEFLSGITKNDKLCPVITVILYYGKEEWDGSQTLYDMLDIDTESEEFHALSDYLPNYKINLVSVRNIEHLEYFRTSLQYVFGMIKYSTDKEALYRYARDNREQLMQLDEDSVMAIFSLLGETRRLMRSVRKAQLNKGGFDMCQAIDELIMDGEKRGREIGLKQGKVLGEKRGERRGEKRGEARMSSLILELLRSGRQDMIEKAASDGKLRNRLYKEYHL